MGSDFLSKIEKAEANKKTPWYVPGNYVVDIVKCDSFESKKAETTMVVVEARVVSYEPKDGSDPKAFVKDGEVAWLPDMAKKPTAGNLKKFAIEVLKQLAFNQGKDPAQVTEDKVTGEVLKNIFCENSWAKGLRMNVTAFNVETKAKTKFTVVNHTARFVTD